MIVTKTLGVDVSVVISNQWCSDERTVRECSCVAYNKQPHK